MTKKSTTWTMKKIRRRCATHKSEFVTFEAWTPNAGSKEKAYDVPVTLCKRCVKGARQ